MAIGRLILRLCLRVWRGREGRVLEKKKERTSGRNRRQWDKRVLRVNFLFIIQNPPYLKKLKKCIGRGFWGILEGSYEFFKSNL